MKETLLTKEGLKDLKVRLDQLLNVTRKKVIEELQLAREQGDISENADYNAAREKQSKVEAEIQKLQFVLDNHKIITKPKNVKASSKGVKVGNMVVVKNLKTQKDVTYQIVGSFELNPFENKISNESPLAQAIIGKEVGNIVKVNSKNPYKIKIIKID